MDPKPAPFCTGPEGRYQDLVGIGKSSGAGCHPARLERPSLVQAVAGVTDRDHKGTVRRAIAELRFFFGGLFGFALRRRKITGLECRQGFIREGCSSNRGIPDALIVVSGPCLDAIRHIFCFGEAAGAVSLAV